MRTTLLALTSTLSSAVLACSSAGTPSTTPSGAGQVGAWQCASAEVPNGSTIACTATALALTDAYTCAPGDPSATCPPSEVDAAAPTGCSNSCGRGCGVYDAGTPVDDGGSGGGNCGPGAGGSGGSSGGTTGSGAGGGSSGGGTGSESGGSGLGNGNGNGNGGGNGSGHGSGSGNGNGSGSGSGGSTSGDAGAAPPPSGGGNGTGDAGAASPPSGGSNGTGDAGAAPPPSGSGSSSGGGYTPRIAWSCTPGSGSVTCSGPISCAPGTHESQCGACVPDGTCDDCVPPTSGGCWVTGGGFIGTAGQNDSFGGNAMPMHSGTIRGEWEDVDHATGNMAHGEAQYLFCRQVNEPGPGQPSGPSHDFTINQVYFGGPARWFVNGTWSDGYWFDVMAEDHGEGKGAHAGGPDYYHVTVRQISAAGVSGAIVHDAEANLSGGNIQIHPPNSGHPYTASALPAWVSLQP